MNSLPESIQLPDRLQELSDATQNIVSHAVAIELDINNSSVRYDRKKKLVQAAVNDLDRQCANVYMGQSVEIEGVYSYSVPLNHGEDVLLKTVHEVGVRRAIAQGFYGQLVEMEGEGSTFNPDEFQAKIFHGASIGAMVIRNFHVDLSGTGTLQAPVTESGLSLTAVEDYRSQVEAERKIRQSEVLSQWTDSFDELLYSPDGIDLPKIGNLLLQLRLVQGDKVYDYLTYINSIIKADVDIAEILCDHLLDYSVEQKSPVWVSSQNVISGWEPTIGMGDAYRMDRAKQRVTKLSLQEPVLTLRAQVQGSGDEHILHIPLFAIQCSEFK